MLGTLTIFHQTCMTTPTGQEELYDKMRKEVIERGVKWEGLYAGCYYALYKGPIENGGHNLEINPDRMQPMATW